MNSCWAHIFCLVLIGGDVFAKNSRALQLAALARGEMKVYRWDGGSGMSL